MNGLPSEADRNLPTDVPVARQFGIIDLFGVMTMAALLSAIVAPLVRDFKNEDYLRLIFFGGVQVVSVGIPFAFAIHQRHR